MAQNKLLASWYHIDGFQQMHVRHPLHIFVFFGTFPQGSRKDDPDHDARYWWLADDEQAGAFSCVSYNNGYIGNKWCQDQAFLVTDDDVAAMFVLNFGYDRYFTPEESLSLRLLPRRSEE